MQEPADTELLRQYAEQDSESAFAALVTRHVNLVYSAALRQVSDPHLAEEITQAVFIILARKARALRRETILSGWLYQTARLTAANFLRNEIRRVRREQEAYMTQKLVDLCGLAIIPRQARLNGLFQNNRDAGGGKNEVAQTSRGATAGN